jgi:hypothetical protein
MLFHCWSLFRGVVKLLGREGDYFVDADDLGLGLAGGGVPGLGENHVLGLLLRGHMGGILVDLQLGELGVQAGVALEGVVVAL